MNKRRAVDEPTSKIGYETELNPDAVFHVRQIWVPILMKGINELGNWMF